MRDIALAVVVGAAVIILVLAASWFRARQTRLARDLPT